jgi:hypothetical protein
MKSTIRIAAVCALMLGAGTIAASADACSGRSHDTGTALGAGGGALIGGLASHSIAGAVVGGVAGGFAGNAIARNEDCNDRNRSHYRHREREHDSYIGRDGRRHYR